MAPTTSSVPRFSILLSKKTAKLAVDRNRIKRVTSALLAELLPSLPPADYLIIPKRSVLDTPHSDLLSDLSSLIPKLKK
jgi:ribonuclease P protein component